MKPFIVFLMLALASPVVSAQFWSGNLLLQRLTSGSSMDVVNAYGYIIGVADATNGNGQHCVPNGVTVRQLSDVVQRFLENVPEMRHGPADSFVNVALRNAWPCKSRSSL